MEGWSGVAEEWGQGHYRDVPISKWVRLARERHVRDLKRQRTPDFPYYFDEDAADHAVWFFETQLRHVDGKWSGQPFLLEAWQEWDIIRILFGWKRLDGTRRFRKFLILIPRKNGKSILIAGIGIYMLVADNEPGAQVYCTATKEEQAKIVWNLAARMIRRSPLLRSEVRTFAKSLYCKELESVMKPLGRDSKTHEGFNVHCGIVDELHAHPTNAMVSVLEEGTGVRTQPMIGMISTAGDILECPCRNEQRYGEKLLEGTEVNEEYFVYICTVDDPEKWEDEAEWQKANPMLGISLSWDDFRKTMKVAKARPENRSETLIKRLNIWCERKEVFIPGDKWRDSDALVDWHQFEGKRCFAAFDLGMSHDLSAIVLAFMDERDAENRSKILPRVYLKGHYWVPEGSLAERSAQEKYNYQPWIDQKWITITPGPRRDTEWIKRDFLEMRSRFDIARIVGDRWQAYDFLAWLETLDMEAKEIPQSAKHLNFGLRKLFDLVLEKRLTTNMDPVMRWMIGNTRVVVDSNENMKIHKNRCPDRVDGIVAAGMAIGELFIAPEPVRFPYLNRGIAFV